MLRVVLASLLALAAPAAAQTEGEAEPRPAPRVPAREAVVANNTDRVLRELYVHPADAEERGPDRLGTGVLPPRATLRVPLDRRAAGGRGGCAYQAVAVFEDGEEERRRFDACRNPRAAFADAAPAREVEVQNDTDLPLRELYLFPPGSRDRGRDRLGAETIAAGESFRLRLRGAGACVFDVRAVFTDDSEEARERVDLCRARRLGFGDPTAPMREVPVVNRGRAPIRELYARPAAGAAAPGGAGGWGADRLGAAMIAPRDDFRLRVRSRACAFDLRAVSANNREEVREGVDLCAVQGVVFGERPEEAPRRVVLLNSHNRTVRQAFLAPTKSGEWGEDALGAAVLAPGGRYEATFEGGCHADLRIVFDTEAAEERRGIDICADTAVALRPGWTVDERLGPPPPPRGEERPAAAAPAKPEPAAPVAAASKGPAGAVRLRNAAAVPLVALHADPIGAPRGPDRLGRAALEAGESMEFAPPEDLPPGPARCLADLTAVFGDGRELRLPARDICAGGEVVLE